MAEISFVAIAVQADARVYRAAGLATGDTTSVLTINQGDWDIGVHVYGTVGGATITILGGIASEVTDLALIDDAYGSALSFTSLPQFKPVGPPARMLRGVVAAGAGTGITIDVIVTEKRL